MSDNKDLKICVKCNKEKSLSEFRKNCFSNNKQYYVAQCKECQCAKIAKRDKLYIESVRTNTPWRLSWWNLRKRCKFDSGYINKGINYTITLSQIKEIWFRDKAYEMKRPSIDRINNDKGYHFNNCQFIELSINSVKDKNNKKNRHDQQQAKG